MRVDTNKGTYILWLHVAVTAVVRVGRLGSFAFPVGWYAYVGSAMGLGGLQGRLRHHFAPIRRPHWHIDFLRQVAISKEAWIIIDATSHEHRWASLLRDMPGASISVRHFGASDCRCETHLFHFIDQPDFAVFRGQSARASPETDAVYLVALTDIWNNGS